VHGAVISSVRQLEREAGHLHPTTPKVTKEWRHRDDECSLYIEKEKVIGKLMGKVTFPVVMF
jgi:hypothetical protein